MTSAEKRLCEMFILSTSRFTGVSRDMSSKKNLKSYLPLSREGRTSYLNPESGIQYWNVALTFSDTSPFRSLHFDDSKLSEISSVISATTYLFSSEADTNSYLTR